GASIACCCRRTRVGGSNCRETRAISRRSAVFQPRVLPCFPVKARSQLTFSTARPGGNRLKSGVPMSAVGGNVGGEKRSRGLMNSAYKKVPSEFPDSLVYFAHRKASFPILR